jgi:LmbE family N-acetylglucosaminyl deacetylase
MASARVSCGVLVAVLSATAVVLAGAPPRRQPALTVDASTRLLVVAPHPDDEVLAAGGLLQRVRAAHGAARIVYLTDGDGFPQGVKATEGREDVKPSDFRQYGSTRKEEARAAMRRLGIPADALTFLGFPNEGLSRLLTAYWSDRRPPFTSPYTRRDRPKKSEVLEDGAKFRGEDLSQEIALVIGAFKPTIVLTPRQQDQHVDHCAAWFFTIDALGDVMRVAPDVKADLLTYVIHFDSWPYDEDVPRLRVGPSGWLRMPLTPAEVGTKLDAIRKYKTQMLVMDSFLEAFAKPSEVFARQHNARVVLPLRRDPCEGLR